jgi:hypothetical protein
VCPFCGAAQHEVSAGTAWGWAVGLAMLGAACGPGKEDSASGSTSEATSTSTSTTGTVTGTPTTSDGSDSESSTGTGTSTGGTSSSSTTECVSCSDSSEGGGFIYAAPDMGPGVKECDPWVQDCPIGQKCRPSTSAGVASLHCVPVAESPEQAGDPCAVQGNGPDQTDNCDVGLVCWNGSCVPQCVGSPDAPMCDDPANGCLIGNDETLTLCLPACDPLAQDCEAGLLCLSIGNDLAFVCVPPGSGDGQEFEACELQNSCDPGLACLDSGWATECGGRGFECCLKFCDVTMPTCTGEGAECVPWFEAGMAPAGLEDVGVCRLPE